MQKLITQIALFNSGVKQFEAEVNYHLEQGHKLLGYSIKKKGFRIVCHAKLEMCESKLPENDEAT